MRILYNLPHPADELASEQAGHTVRAAAILRALQSLGHEVITVEAAADQTTQAAVNTYRKVVKRMIPRPVAMRVRDHARVATSRRHAQRVIERARAIDPDVILETHIAFSVSGMMASQETGVPLVLDDVAPSWEEEQQYGVGARQLARTVHKEATTHAALIVTVSQVIKRFLSEEGIPAEKIAVVSNGIGPAFNPQVDGSTHRKAYNIPADAVVIVFVGSFQPYHRVDLLLEAFARVKTDQRAHLLLVGEGQRTPEARAAAERLGLMDRVTFTGRIPYDRVHEYAAAGDIGVMPATNSYGNPMKVYEYMALGKAVLAPNQETITEIATHGQDAYLFEPGNVDALAQALKAVIADADLRRRLGANAARLGPEFTWQRRGELMQGAIQKMLVLSGA